MPSVRRGRTNTGRADADMRRDLTNQGSPGFLTEGPVRGYWEGYWEGQYATTCQINTQSKYRASYHQSNN